MLIWIVNEKKNLQQFYHSMYRFTFKIIIIVNNIRFAVNHSFFIRSYEEHMNTRGEKMLFYFHEMNILKKTYCLDIVLCFLIINCTAAVVVDVFF